MYECDIKNYADIPADVRDRMKAAGQTDIPHYVHNWSKHNQPYISSPTLLTGDNDASDFDTSHKPLYRGRSFSVGNDEMQCHDGDPLGGTYTTDGESNCEYKAHIVWNMMWEQWSSFYKFLCYVKLYVPLESMMIIPYSFRGFEIIKFEWHVVVGEV